MTDTDIFSAEAALDACVAAPLRALDVRSAGEFADGHVPGFVNGPILNDEERHAVGSCYKQQGQDAAIALGLQLTAPHRASRVAHWQALGTPLWLCCWRGGLRSKMAVQWLREAGHEVQRIEGGYKAMRTLLRAEIETPPPLWVLSGPTGCGKTALLRSLNVPHVDLEKLANHRGSAFGRLGEQPAQQVFENGLGLALWKRSGPLLVEDESRLIGRRDLPVAFKQAMTQAPVVVLDVDMAERIDLTFQEYVAEPLAKGVPAAVLQQQLLDAFTRIRNRLGMERYQQLTDCLCAAFTNMLADRDAHAAWILPLLRDYYDPLYHHAFSRQARQVLFRGDRAACAAWLRAQLG